MSNQFRGGSVKISNDILEKITREATLEIEGVHSVGAGHDFVSFEKFTTVESHKGLKIAVGQGKLRIEVRVVLEAVESIPSVCEAVQRNVVEKIRVMTGLEVVEINVHVESVAR